MSHYKPYPAYKDSGVEWLGQVPEHWAVSPLKYSVTFRSGGTPSKDNLDFWDGDIPWASAKDLKKEQLEDTQDHLTGLAVTSGAASLVAAGSVLVVVRGMILARTFPVVEAMVPMAINQDLKALQASQALDARFLAYLLRGLANESLRRLEEAGHGTKALRMELWTSMQLTIPPKEEQRTISAYLDRETARLDALVAKKTRFIELLREKRQALITQAVTRGLDPKVKMKDSGVEWLGAVPEHWTVVRFRDLCVSISTGPFGTALGNEDYVTGGVPVINPSHISEDQCCPDPGISVSAETAVRLSFWAMQVGDLVTARRGELGRAAVITDEQDGWICGTGSLRVRPDSGRVLAGYLHTVLQSRYAREWLNQSSVGATMANLNESILGQLPLALPPSTMEQSTLLATLEALTARLNKVEEKASASVSLLQERRSALITAAVTGQIDLREPV